MDSKHFFSLSFLEIIVGIIAIVIARYTCNYFESCVSRFITNAWWTVGGMNVFYAIIIFYVAAAITRLIVRGNLSNFFVLKPLKLRFYKKMMRAKLSAFDYGVLLIVFVAIFFIIDLGLKKGLIISLFYSIIGVALASINLKFKHALWKEGYWKKK